MKKIILYDDVYFQLLTCLLMGVDSDGNPQLVVTTSGSKLESFQDYINCLRNNRLYVYLGEEGGTVPDKEIIRLFTCYLVMSEFQHHDLADLIKSLKLAGLKWSDNFQKLTFDVVCRLNDEKDVVFALYVYLDAGGQYCIAYNLEYASLREVLDRIRLTMYELSNRADIPVACDLSITKNLKKELSVDDCAIFDNIHIND